LEERFAMGADGGSTLIVQFEGPAGVEQVRELEGAGLKVMGYFPDNAYVVDARTVGPGTVRKLPGVIGSSNFWPGLKFSPEIDAYMGAGLISGAPYTSLRVLTFYDDPDMLPELSRRSPDVEKVSPVRYELSLPVIDLEGLVRMDAVSWLEPTVPMELKNDVAASVIGADTIWDTYGLDGTGQVVGIADSGCDTGVDDHGTNGDMHADLDNRVRLANWAGTSPDDTNGHGTHVTGSVAGNGASSSGAFKGMAPNASVFFQGIMSDGGSLITPSDLRMLFSQAYSNGSKVHTNSWGSSGLYGDYITECFEVDEFMFSNPQMLILFAAGNDGWDSNSDGKIDANSVSPPATAKNCLTVGASENLRGSGGLQMTWNQAFGYPTNPIRNDRLSNNSRGLAAFSARGPLDDGRLKPDIVAPGTNILSLRSSQTSSSGWGLHSNPAYMYMGGTSMSTPVTAGAAALVREHYVVERGHTAPTGALIKATMINGAFDMTPGQYGAANPTTKEVNRRPDNDQGWGLLDLEGAIHPPGKNVTYMDDPLGLATGASASRVFRVMSSRELRLTLAWSDYPSQVFTGKQLVNDLDLILESPTGVIYHGNDLSAPYNDQKDSTNNVEGISIELPEVGWWKATVNGSSVAMGGKQHFALVGSGDMGPFVTESVGFSKEYYSTDGEQVWVSLTSRDLLGMGSVLIQVNSSSDHAGRSVLLTEEGLFGSFRGSLLTSNVTTADTGRIHVRDGDTLGASYLSPSFILFTASATAKTPLRVDIIRSPDHHLTYTRYETILFTGMGRPGTAASYLLPGSPFGWRPLWDDGNPVHNDRWVGDGVYGDALDIDMNMSFSSMLRVRVVDPYLGDREYEQFIINVNTSLPRAVRALRASPLPDGNRAFLSWNRSSSSGLSHYSVFINLSGVLPGPSPEGWARIENTTDIRNTTVVEGLTDGTSYGFRVVAVNSQGNVSSLSNIAWCVPGDSLYPQVELLTPPRTLTGTALLEFGTEGDLSLLEVEYYNDTDGNGAPDDGNGFIRIHTGPSSQVLWDTRSQAGGPGDMTNIIVRYRGQDEVPNISPWTLTAGFSIDNTGPSLLEIDPEPSRVTRVREQVLAGYTEPRAVIEVTLNGLPLSRINATSTGIFDLRFELSEGLNTLSFNAFDRNGAGPTVLSYLITLDTMGPEAVILGLLPEVEISATGLNLTSGSTDSGMDPEMAMIGGHQWKLRDPFGKEVQGNGPSFGAALEFLGNHTISLTVYDLAGNSDTINQRFLVKDTIAPAVVIDGPAFVDEDINVRYTSFGSADNDPTLFVKSRARHQWTFSGPLNWNYTTEREAPSVMFQDPGRYSITLEVVDAGGNVGTALLNITVNDRTPPVLLIRGEDRFYKGESGKFTFDIDDNGNASIATSGARWELWFTDGPAPELISSTEGVEASFRFERAGNHSVRLFASDDTLNNATAQMRVYVGERPVTDDGEDERTISLALLAMIAAAVLIGLVIIIVTVLILKKRDKEIVDEEWEDEEELDDDEVDDDEAEDWGDWE
jgi:subtilisin family serine protease